MKKGFSLYCDVLRLSAALAVCVSHASWRSLSGGFLYQFGVLAHPAVMVFFVLSGFVISYVASERETDLRSYALSRLARLYSVVLPAIALAFVLDRIGMLHAPDVYDAARETAPLLRIVTASLFLSHTWYWELSLFSNDAFWSLPYEFWYYVLFGAAMFLSGFLRIATVIAAALIAGPNILILLPVWLAGVAAYRMSRRYRISAMWARWLFVLSLLCAVGTVAMRSWMFTDAATIHLPPGFSLFDYALGAALAIHLYAGAHLDFPLEKLSKPIHDAAGMTFSLYLFHLPIMFLATAYLPRAWPAELRGPVLLIIVGVSVFLLSKLTEGRKGDLKKWFDRWLPRPPAQVSPRAAS